MRRLLHLFLIPLLLAACAENRGVPLPATDDQSNTEIIKEEKSVPVERNNKLSEVPKSCLDFPENKDLITKPFQMVNDYEGAGQVTLSGTVTKRDGEVWGQPVDKVYFAIHRPAIEGPDQRFFDYFNGMIDSGNTVNLGSKFGDSMGFTLGIIDNGKFSSTAGVSDSAHDAIMSVLDTGESISLTLSVPKYLGMGAPANFSFVCMIELQVK